VVAVAVAEAVVEVDIVAGVAVVEGGVTRLVDDAVVAGAVDATEDDAGEDATTSGRPAREKLETSAE
jgi:hypothetical protein